MEKKTLYICTLNVQHDLKDYEPGEEIELTAKQARQLLEAGAVIKAAKKSAPTKPKTNGGRNKKPGTKKETPDPAVDKEDPPVETPKAGK
jgi:hypothetical protein